eukprot:1230381-Prymnesium_polylepis.1
MFVKYNGVLRGVDGRVPFLVKGMVKLCCAAGVSKQFEANKLSFGEVLPKLNTYTTTLHAINSAIVKLSKLTFAGKVYRGVSGLALPPEFWAANIFGVKGGIDGAFMSTTSHRDVAMSYAASGGKGIVFEVPSRARDAVRPAHWHRGARHARRGCGAGRRVRRLIYRPPHPDLLALLHSLRPARSAHHDSPFYLPRRVALSVNLASLTIDQVLSKRQKVVADMCTQLALKARQKAQTEEWALLRTGGNEKEDVPTAVEAFLEQHLMSLAKKKPEHYNENEPLGEAIQEAVALVDILEGWPQGLRALSDMMKVTTEALVTSTEPIRLPEKELTQQMAEGLCALMWVRPTLEITLDGCTLSSPKCLVVLARTLRPT